MRYAARILVDQLSVFAQLEGTALPTEEKKALLTHEEITTTLPKAKALWRPRRGAPD